MSDNHDRAIGRLEGKLDRVIESQDRADTGRKRLYGLMEALRAEISGYRRRLDDLEKRIDALEEPVAEIKKWRERSIGSVLTLSALAALLGGTLATSWHKILDIFK